MAHIILSSIDPGDQCPTLHRTNRNEGLASSFRTNPFAAAPSLSHYLNGVETRTPAVDSPPEESNPLWIMPTNGRDAFQATPDGRGAHKRIYRCISL